MDRKPSFGADFWVQFGILVVMSMGAVGAFATWCDGRYAKNTDLVYQTDSIKELKGEMDALYIHLIPDATPQKLRHREVVGNQ